MLLWLTHRILHKKLQCPESQQVQYIVLKSSISKEHPEQKPEALNLWNIQV